MKIVHVLSHQSPLDPQRLVGVKRVVMELAQAQTKRGHSVYIIAPKGSKSNVGNIIETIVPLREIDISVYDPRSYIYGMIHSNLAADYITNNQFDIVHNHAEQFFLPFVNFINTPTVSTIHGTNFTEDVKFIYRSFYGKFIAISLSNYAKIANDYIQYRQTIYNGIDVSSIKPNFSSQKDGILWFGRINPQKGVLEAGLVSERIKRKLLIRGYAEKGMEEYLQKITLEFKNSDYVDIKDSFVDEKGKENLYTSSRVCLFPIAWEEPFGLVMVESMAAGTPVVAFARGSAPEIIKDGKTGFLVNYSDEDIRGDFIIKKTGIDGLSEAVEKVYSMEGSEYIDMQQVCRKHVEENFSIEKMIEGYEKVYQEVRIK